MTTLDAPSGDLKHPLYIRLLRLRHVQPSAWQRAALFEGVGTIGIIGALADRWSAWTPVVLPVAMAAVVKFHDLLAGVLRATPARRPPDDG
ncbi:MAG: hypothetical protein ABR520_02620 [Mycobacteriales bacterium]|nr:hypothetical protein [Frankia sp.]